MPDEQTKIAYVDFDGTLVKSHCVDYLIQIQKSLKHPLLFILWGFFLRLRAFKFKRLHRLSAEKFDRYYYRFFRGIREDDLNKAVVDRVIPFICSKHFPDAVSKIETLRDQGYQVVLVSGSLKNIIEPFASELGAIACLATELEVSDGVFTGQIKGDSVNNHAKRNAIKAYQATLPNKPVKVFAIGNSQWDIPMLEFADEACVVNPDKKLLHWAQNQQVDINDWKLEKIPLRFYFLHLLLRPFIEEVSGMCHIPRNRGAIIIANHCSYLDHYLIGLSVMCKYGRRVRFLAKKEHFKRPLDRWFHEWLGAFPIDRSAVNRESLLNVVKLLENKELVLIYPEGTRSLDGQLQEFKPGVLFTHYQSGSAIVPAGITGAFDVLPSGKLFPRFAKMSLRFNKSISFTDKKMPLPKSEVRKEQIGCLRNNVKVLCQKTEVVN